MCCEPVLMSVYCNAASSYLATHYFFLSFLFFERFFQYRQASLDSSSCLSFLSVGITGMCYHIQNSTEF